MKIWAHTIVRNEERYVWYSVMSVINHVDKILLWDMDSTDNTWKILESIKENYPDKVHLKKVGKVTPDGFAKVRWQMLNDTKADWFLVVDGDEIWWEESIKKVIEGIKTEKHNIESIFVPIINAVGDIFHYQEEKAGLYTIAGKKGHYSIRAINRNIPGLGSSKPHGKWGWTDGEGKMIQDRDNKKILFVDAPYLHTTYLPRGGNRSEDEKVIKRAQKLKYEIGNTFPLDFYYPEAFFIDRPDFVPSPWSVMDKSFYQRALIETPLRKLKRRVLKAKSGY